MPGSGISIEIYTLTYERPYLFGAMLSRDEVFDSIIAHAHSLGLDWASRFTLESSSNKSIRKSDESGLEQADGAGAAAADDIGASAGCELRHRSFRMSDLQQQSDGDDESVSSAATGSPVVTGLLDMTASV